MLQVLLIALSSFSGDIFVGEYGYYESGAKERIVATVRRTPTAYAVQFKKGCLAYLKLENIHERVDGTRFQYTGECVSGKGYQQVNYKAVLRMERNYPTLYWIGLEYGDPELGFDSYSSAINFGVPNK